MGDVMRILFIFLGLLAVAFLVHIFMNSEKQHSGNSTPGAPVDVTTNESTTVQQLRPVPETQMTVIKGVFAPELEN